MTLTIKKSKANGFVTAPPSKSAAHRVLICGALSSGSVIKNIEFSNDISATLECLEKLGANVKICGNTVKIGGITPQTINETVIDCRESGSTLRFLIPICMLSGKKITLTGSSRLFERNLTIYEDIAKQNAIVFEKHENTLTVCGKIKSGNYKIAGNISSQFISGMMFALPILCGDSVVEITGDYESEPYVDLTVDALKKFGVIITKCENTYKIKGNQTYNSQTVTVEGDYSNAAFLDAFNLLGGTVTVTGLESNSLQGDKIYKSMFYDLSHKKDTFDLSNCPDLAPIMFALSVMFGKTNFVGTRRLKIKESDRATVMAEELAKFGIKTDVGENNVTVYGGTLKKPVEILNGHNDHRIVMALSTLCSVTGGTISGVEAVAKSYPDYFEKIKSLGIVVKNETN